MNAIKMLALVLIAAGVWGLVYSNFSYTREAQQVKIGPLEWVVKDTETVHVPVWVGVAAIVAGGALLLVAGKKK